MARSDETPLDGAIPEVDRLEQEQQADPRVSVDEEWPAPGGPDGDEADRLEQAQEVVGDPDEEYAPHET
ncbi:hypothetical protein ACOCJ4_11685 [Knoellia sp. CPCC 206435]|uniref:hypothetical protein n=1 Tax=Knoellia terrae TaxID=3404797 RepID=UPI003B42EAA6